MAALYFCIDVAISQAKNLTDMATLFNKRLLTRRGLLRNMLLLIPGIAGHFIINSRLVKSGHLTDILTRIDVVYLIIIVVMICNSLLMIFLDVYSSTDKSRQRPLKAVVQAVQVGIIFVAGIIALAILIDKSPKVLLTGLGASAAVLMLVFKDSIMGLVAGVQLSANDMLHPGDWITMEKYGADGMVQDVSLTTVKVQNWDKTITTVPPYALVSESFQNWRGMFDSGGRRIKRSIFIDMNSIAFCTAEQTKALAEKKLVDSASERAVNLTIFREWLEMWLKNHPKVNKGMITMVRQLQPTAQGLPLELYFFFNGTDWVDYEHLQAEVFEYILATLPKFGLKVFQSPTGNDIKIFSGSEDAL